MENIHQGHREKMRQRFLKSGLEGFADHEALELLLYYAIPRQDTNPIAHRLMDRYGSLTAVLSAPAEDLKKVEGIGESAAVLLKVAGQIGRKARLADAVAELSHDRCGNCGRLLAGTVRRGDPRGRLRACAWIERASCWPASGFNDGGAVLRRAGHPEGGGKCHPHLCQYGDPGSQSPQRHCAALGR